jgi:hypothetical protein
MGFVAQVGKMSDPSTTETVWIENMSHQGARILARQSLPTDDLLIVSSQKSGFHPVVGKVVHSQRFSNGAVAIDLEFGGSGQMLLSGTSQKTDPV